MYPVVRFTVAGRDTQLTALGRPYTVIYDGACKVCGRLVRVLRKWDRHGMLEIIPSHSAGLHARYPWIPARAYTESVQLVEEGGATWQGAAAVERILDVLPKGKLLTWIFSIPFVRPLAERFYRWFARNRYRMGCGKHCQFRPLAVEYGEEELPHREKQSG